MAMLEYHGDVYLGYGVDFGQLVDQKVDNWPKSTVSLNRFFCLDVRYMDL